MISKLIKLGMILSVLVIVQACGQGGSDYPAMDLNIESISIMRDCTKTDSVEVDTSESIKVVESQIFIDSI
tara:strand:- start:162 stop:374 length:213 start_codon:yes stop_codon:yes gene_type:complete